MVCDICDVILKPMLHLLKKVNSLAYIDFVEKHLVYQPNPELSRNIKMVYTAESQAYYVNT